MTAKTFGQIFTPPNLVSFILDEAGYTGGAVINAKVMEPAFGTGNFLVEIINRIIIESRKAHLPTECIKTKLENNIYGIELDKVLYTQCISRLNKLVLDAGIPCPKWNLANSDTLDHKNEFYFDYVVGNPPYIRIQKLSQTTRKKIKSYAFSGGNTDLYITFFEIGLNMLSPTGTLAYITPNSFINNTSQTSFRKHLIKNNFVEKIINFGTSHVFDNADTYAAITILKKSKIDDKIIYQQRDKNNLIDTSIIYPARFPNEESMGFPWHFCNQINEDCLREIYLRKTKLNTLCTAQHGCATNKDNVYVGTVKPFKKDLVYFNGIPVEKELLRPAIKGGRPDSANKFYILFPYKFSCDKKYTPICEELLQSKYPYAYSYFLSHKEELLARNMDSSAQTWYQYARSQSINTEQLKKLVVRNTIAPIQKKCCVVEADAGTIVYSGVFVTVKDDLQIPVIRKILESEDFCHYCKLVGKDISGGYKSISAKHINNYGIR